jgi:hypothetical protein
MIKINENDACLILQIKNFRTMGSLFLVLDLTTHASLQIKRLIIAVSH